MADILTRNLESDGEVRSFTHGRAIFGHVGGVAVLRGEFQPGWRWSTDVAPQAGTDSCQVRHQGYVAGGSMCIRMEDGSETTLTTGDVFDIPAGHDAWVVGDAQCTLIDMSPDAARYALPRPAGIAAAEDEWMALVRRGYEAFNAKDIPGLLTLFAEDVQQHVPGTGEFAGTHKGPEAVLGYYGALAERTDGTFRADLVDLHSDGNGHVLAIHNLSFVLDGMPRLSRGSLLFSFIGHKAHELTEFRGDIAGDDAIWSS